VLTCIGSQRRCSSVQYCGRIIYSFLMLQVARSVLMCDCILQMSENRRRGGRRAQQEQIALQDEAHYQPLPPPPR
jgi:hypothetical protein